MAVCKPYRINAGIIGSLFTGLQVYNSECLQKLLRVKFKDDNIMGKKRPLFIAFSTQKGGAGKSIFTTLAASFLHYQRGYNIVVIDCDAGQYSLSSAWH